MVCNHHWMETLFTDEKLIFNCETMKLLKINLTVDEQNVLIKSRKTTIIIIKVILVWCVIIIGWKLYLLMKN